MTVANNVARNQYSATNGQTVFSYTFEIAEAANIAIYQRAASAAPDDTADLLQYLVDYTLTGVGDQNGGTFVLVSGAALGDILTAQSVVPADRDSSFTPAGLIQADDLNIEFDNQTLIEQRLLTLINKLIPKYANSAVVAARDLTLPILGNNQIWQMDTDSGEIQAVTFDSSTSAAALQAALASHDPGEGASMVGLQGAGTVQDLTVPKYIIQVANTVLPNAQALASLTTGILKSTFATGVLSISAPLTSIDGLTTVADQMLYTTGVNTYATTTLTALARSLLDDATQGAMQSTLGLVIGTNVQAFNANLQSLSALGTIADRIAYTTGVATWAETPLTSFMRTVLDDTTAAAAAVTLAVLPLTGGTLSGELFLVNSTPSTDLAAASRGYVLAIAEGRVFKDPVVAATTGAFSATYSNGSSGVGATLTGTVMAAFAPDGVTLALGDRILFKDQASSFENGIYTTTVLGTGAVLPVFTRSTDMNLASEFKGATTFITGGSTQGGQTYTETATVVTIGTDAVTFALTGDQSGVSSVATAGLATGGPITATGTVTVTAASQSDQETGTSNTVAVTPGVQKFHPSATKAWASVNISGGAASSLQSYNISSYNNNGTGNYSANFAVSFSAVNFCAVGVINGSGASYGFMNVRIDDAARVIIYTATGTVAIPVQADLNFSVNCYGDQ